MQPRRSIAPPVRATIARLIGLIALLIAVEGCYVSAPLLIDPADAVHPLVDGVYARQGNAKDRFRLTLKADGWYAVERIAPSGLWGETHRVLAAPSGDGLILAEARDDGYAYGVARISGARLFLAAPDCADPLDRGDAQDAGASGDDDDDFAHPCRFRSRAALTAALSAFAGHADFGAPYVRVVAEPGH